MRARVRSPRQHPVRRHRLPTFLKLVFCTLWAAALVWVLVTNWRVAGRGTASTIAVKSSIAEALSVASGTAARAALNQASILVHQQGFAGSWSSGSELAGSRRERVMSEGASGQHAQQGEVALAAGSTAQQSTGQLFQGELEGAGAMQQPMQQAKQAQQGQRAQQAEDGSWVSSHAKVHAPPSASGEPVRYYYTFHDVRLTRDRLQFFLPRGFKAPRNHWVDAAASNATNPSLPSTLVFKGDSSNANWTTLPVKYIPSLKEPAKCRGWVEKPTYLLVRSRGWDEVLGAFQTLREQGALPMVQVDANANMREVVEGLGASCPVVFDPKAKRMGPDSTCAPTAGVVEGRSCDQKNQAWCRPGVWRYERRGGPLILSFGPRSAQGIWGVLYSAMTNDLRDLPQLEGFCFRHLMIGRTATLDFNRSANGTAAQAQRAEATAVFKAFAVTALREWQRLRMVPSWQQFKGYKDRGWEHLRRGIGPEKIKRLSIMSPQEVPGMALGVAAKERKRWQQKEKSKKKAKDLAKMEEAQSVQDVAAAQGADPSALLAVVGANPDTLLGRKMLAAAELGTVPNAAGAAATRGGARAAAKAMASGSSSVGPREKAELEAAELGSGSAGVGSLVEGGDSQILQGVASDAGKQGTSMDPAGEVVVEYDPEIEGEGEEEEAGEGVAVEAEAGVMMPPLLQESGLPLESPRPVVTYMARPNFSRGVLNEQDILRYILKRYNVTLRVTLLTEPFEEVVATLQHTDVLIGMYSEGWANGLFIKQGAAAVLLYPYGWGLPSGQPIRGQKYREILMASKCKLFEWYNPNPQYAFFRQDDFSKNKRDSAPLHPLPSDPTPTNDRPADRWLYQNTYVDMDLFGKVIKQAMAAAGIQPIGRQAQQVQPDVVSNPMQQVVEQAAGETQGILSERGNALKGKAGQHQARQSAVPERTSRRSGKVGQQAKQDTVSQSVRDRRRGAGQHASLQQEGQSEQVAGE